MTGAHWPYAPIEDEALFGSCEGHDHRFNEISLGVALGRQGQGLRVVDADRYRRNVWESDYDERTTAHMIAHYDAGVRRFDDLAARLLDSMRGSGLLDRTVVVVTSDHGESFGEHGDLHHGQRVDDIVMRVPLILRLPPDHADAAKGAVVDQLVRTVDLLPTLLEAVGAPVPDGLDGVSLLPALRGESLPIAFAYGESGRSLSGVDPERHYPGVEGKHRMIRTADWKLVRVPNPAGDEDRLYDLRVDPGEHHDVAARAPEVVARLRAHLDAILAHEEAAPETTLSPDEREALRRLGYAE